MDFSKFVENIGDSTATSFVCFDENNIFLFRLTSESKKEYIFIKLVHTPIMWIGDQIFVLLKEVLYRALNGQHIHCLLYTSPSPRDRG